MKKINNPDEKARMWTTTKDKNNSIGYFVFHVFGEFHGFYDWWATLTANEQEECRNKVIAIISSVNKRD